MLSLLASQLLGLRDMNEVSTPVGALGAAAVGRIDATLLPRVVEETPFSEVMVPGQKQPCRQFGVV